jgi:PIN domain nuclease of toxin-antitoxin system
VRVLLDTELALCWQIAPDLVPDSVLATVLSPGTRAYISDATLWELAVRCSDGRLHLDLPLFRDQCADDGFQWLPITPEHVMDVATLPFSRGHRDLFARLRVSQSQREPLVLLTTNPDLAEYGATVRVVDPVREASLPVVSRANARSGAS